jgi:hypothetical protein
MNPFRRRIQTAMQSGGGAAAFSPTDIAGLKLWLDASQITGLNDGDAVSTWSDLSGNGRNFTQATASYRPTYKTNIRGSLPVVRFDGVDDYLAGSWAGTTVKTVVVVLEITGATPPFSAVNQLTHSGGGYINLQRGSSNTELFTRDTVIGSGPTLSGIASGFMVASFRFDTSNMWLRANGASAGPSGSVFSTTISSGVLAWNFPSATQYVSGDYAHVLYYDTVLSDADVGRLESYFASH